MAAAARRAAPWRAACALLGLLLVAPSTLSFPEYAKELPNIPVVNGAAWAGVGHVARDGGGLRNKFGEDFAAAGYAWNKQLCEQDSDGDGFTNGQELGDPDCAWRKGQPAPSNGGLLVSHPGLPQSVPKPAKQQPGGGGSSNSNNSISSSSSGNSSSSSSAALAAAAAPGGWVEPNADMPVPQGSERNLNGDQPQRWCEARHTAAAGGERSVGTDQQWHNFTLPDMTVLGTPDMYSCHPFRIPDSVPDHREFVGVRVGLDQEAHLHHVLLMECPGDLWFLKDITRNSEMCTTHSGTMFSACNRWWIATEANNNYQMCTPPGLIYARAGEMRKNNKVLVLQVHWVFGKKLQNTSVDIGNATLELLHEEPPAPPAKPTEIMETLEGTAVYPPSLMQHVNGLVIPAGHDQWTSSYTCARRCTYIPLGRLQPKPVTVAGYTFHGHHYMTGMRMRIKRCPLHSNLPDVSWEVTDWQQSVVHPTYDRMGAPVQLYPGDELSWDCIYNTSRTNRTVYGGYAGYSEEMCIMLLHYYPRNAMLRGCNAVTADQGGHSICMFEAAQVIGFQSEEATRVPIRTILAPRTLPRWPGNLYPGYKASIILFWMLVLTGFLWGSSCLLNRWPRLGLWHRAYRGATLQNRRSMVVYLMHVLLDTLILALWFEPVFGGWCGCTESAPTHGWLLGFNLLYIVVSYAIELVWRTRVDTMLAIHHVCTILIIAVMFGELPSEVYQFADALVALGVFAVLEQPTFVALLLKRLLPAGNRHITRAWAVAVWSWFATKLFSVGLAVWFISRDWKIMPTWARVSYIVIWALVGSIQMWSGFVQRSILQGVRRDELRQELLPDAQFLSDGVSASSTDESWATSSGDGGDGGGGGRQDCKIRVAAGKDAGKGAGKAGHV